LHSFAFEEFLLLCVAAGSLPCMAVARKLAARNLSHR
jgi:hypothetical protein